MPQSCSRCGTNTKAEVVLQQNNEILCIPCKNAQVQQVIERLQMRIGQLVTAKLKLASLRDKSNARSVLKAGVEEVIQQLELAADDALIKAKAALFSEDAEQTAQTEAAVAEILRLSSLVNSLGVQEITTDNLKTLCARRDSMRQLMDDVGDLKTTMRDLKKRNLLSGYSVSKKFTMIFTKLICFQLVIPDKNPQVGIGFPTEGVFPDNTTNKFQPNIPPLPPRFHNPPFMLSPEPTSKSPSVISKEDSNSDTDLSESTEDEDIPGRRFSLLSETTSTDTDLSESTEDQDIPGRRLKKEQRIIRKKGVVQRAKYHLANLKRHRENKKRV